jgi:hypothetical protein
MNHDSSNSRIRTSKRLDINSRRVTLGLWNPNRFTSVSRNFVSNREKLSGHLLYLIEKLLEVLCAGLVCDTSKCPRCELIGIHD